jgi:3-phenylpropionate/trans-cinnamate dioxygenase ferredoxin subunit
MTEQFVRAIATADLPDRSAKAVELEGKDILVCSSGGEYYAVANKCTHADSPLEGGRVRKTFISCPLHGMLFDLRTGEPKGQLTNKPLPTFPVRVVDGFIEIDVGNS